MSISSKVNQFKQHHQIQHALIEVLIAQTGAEADFVIHSMDTCTEIAKSHVVSVQVPVLILTKHVPTGQDTVNATPIWSDENVQKAVEHVNNNLCRTLHSPYL